MRHTREYSIDIGDVELAVVEWEGDSDPILLLHATGFHSRCWTEVVNHLPGQRVLAVDLRYHGSSGASGEPDWAVMADDICQLLEQLSLSQVVGVGHSIGGHLLVRSAAVTPARFKQLVLVDPVIPSLEDYARMEAFVSGIEAADHPVARRRNQWRDAQEMCEHLENRQPFRDWQSAVLRDYCDYALLPADEDGYRALCCDPLNEAALYVNQRGNERVYEALEKITTPVTLLRAKTGDPDIMNLSQSPTWPQLASKIHCCRDIYLPHLNHFIPMLEPGLVARYILSAQRDHWQLEGSA